ncbi:MAG: PEP-CTERM sorting domain-containing protein [Pseudomonadales bacterium]|jgi:hypothetical protein
MKFKLLVTALIVSPYISTATAAPIVLQGDFVKTAISDDGTLGFGGNTSPGLLHDATGTGTFGLDYLTPGVPWEIFSVDSDQSGLLTNYNSGGDAMSGTLSDISGTSVYNNAVNWSGIFGSLFSISTDTYFNNGDERVSFTTTITALDNLTGLSFLRAIDPDPDNYPGGSASTNNGRGFGSLLAQDWVHSVGTLSGLTLGLYSDSSIAHNTGITSPWSFDPANYLAADDAGNGDNAIGLAFDIGNLNTGDSVNFDYHYVMGDQLSTVDIPTDVPEPSTLALFALGVLGLASRRFKKKS